MKHKFKQGDKVTHQVGNTPHQGIIVDGSDHAYWRNEGHCNLAISGEKNFFAWLDVVEQDLIFVL